MENVNRELHPVYGAVPSDGDYVQQGEILGLSVDAREVITAPISGWVELRPVGDSGPSQLTVCIHATRQDRCAYAGDTAA